MKTKRWLSVLFVLAFMFALANTAFAETPASLIANGDFSKGDTGFESDYTYKVESASSTTELWDPFTYGVGTNPNDYHNLWTSYGDHTQDGTRNMMIVNAADFQPSGDVWRQTVALPDYSPVTTKKLMAGQHWEAGEVQIKVEDGTVWVRMILTDQRGDPDAGWRIYGMKVDIKTDCSLIPQKNGNPIPGKFAYKFPFSSGVIDTGWQNTGYAAATGTDLCVAAHADIRHAEVGHWVTTTHNFCVVSGTNTGIAEGGNAVVTTANTWAGMNNTINTALPSPDPANYIWKAEFVTADCADNGGLVNFVQTFNITGQVKTATLMIAADNSYAFSLNAGAETAVNLAPDWRAQVLAGNFDPPIDQGDTGYQAPTVILDGTMTAWGVIRTYDVASSLKTGANRLNVTALNADWNTTDPLVNPAMAIYKLCGTSETKQWVVDQPYDDETGWGDGTPFSGANWATCMHYSVAPSYTLSFYAANSYVGNHADLSIYINDEYLGHADLGTIPASGGPKNDGTGVWQLFTFQVTGVSGPTEISIQNTFNVYQGDDFALDDISLVQN